MKKLICINGTLLFPLEIGKKAIVVKGKDDIIYTSRVIRIYNATKKFACFETLNSIYKVSFQALPIMMPLPKEMAMCA